MAALPARTATGVQAGPGGPRTDPLEAVRALRELCAGFRLPPRFALLYAPHRPEPDVRLGSGSYNLQSDVVGIDPSRAAQNGMGGEDGYYVTLVHELLHATGHPSRLDRESLRNMSEEAYMLEEATASASERIVLEAVGFPTEALDWYALNPAPGDHDAAEAAADWMLGRRDAGGPA